jgi:hypothetical protein
MNSRHKTILSDEFGQINLNWRFIARNIRLNNDLNDWNLMEYGKNMRI